MAEIGFDSWWPVPGYEPTTAVDADDVRYAAWALNDMVRLSFRVSSGYISGSDIVLSFTEKTAGESLNHEFTASVSLNGQTAELFVEQYASPATANEATVRNLELSASGQINSVAVKPGDLVTVTLMRSDASADEDPNDIHIYAPVLYITGGCVGYTGQLIDAVRSEFNERAEKFIFNNEIIRWLNDVKEELSRKGHFCKETALNVVANQADYDTRALMGDNVKVVSVRLLDAEYHLTPCPSWPTFQALSMTPSYWSSGEPGYYFVLSGVVWIWPTPTAAVTGGLLVTHQYAPADFTCWDDADPMVAAGFKDLFVYGALYRAHSKRGADPGARQDMEDYRGRYLEIEQDLFGAGISPATRLVSYR